jgi:hypothetical protein
MARLDLSTRAARIAQLIAGRDLTALPKTVRIQVERFTRAAGIDFDKFVGYAPSTRRRYIAAARKGRTAAQERERVRGQRRERAARRPAVDPRITEIWELRAWLDERIDTTKSGATQTDELDTDILLSTESTQDHIDTYGTAYTLRQMRGMKRGYQDFNEAQNRWRSFKGAATTPDHPDERWFWYHGKLRQVDGLDWKLLR